MPKRQWDGGDKEWIKNHLVCSTFDHDHDDHDHDDHDEFDDHDHDDYDDFDDYGD